MSTEGKPGGDCIQRARYLETGFDGVPKASFEATYTRVPWSQIPHFGPIDIKTIWEPSRFAWAYPMAREFARTGDERIPESFWTALNEWMEANQPNTGPNWMCGQEASLRLIAISIALAAFHGESDLTREQREMMARLALVTGRRVKANIGYALNQKNNHGLSEAAGLWTAALWLPSTRETDKWNKKGRQLIERQVLDLFDEDGSFSQYSVNYHRLALQVCLWCVRLAELEKQPLSEPVLGRLRAATRWLLALTDPDTGKVPRYGQWDGAVLFHLSDCAADDFRPALQTASVILNEQRLFSDGPWDEEAAWLSGRDPKALPIADAGKESHWIAPSGYVVLHDEKGRVVSRAGGFRFRPSQADLLHVDLWWNGENIAIDPGTFSYNSPEPWQNPLARTAFHNTLTVDGQDQMERVSRFLWLPWPKAQGQLWDGEGVSGWQAWHDGFRRRKLAGLHRRAVLRLGDGRWVVVDSIAAKKPRRFRLHWLLAGLPYEWDDHRKEMVVEVMGAPYRLRVASGSDRWSSSVVRADPDSPRGWWAPTYNQRQPAISLACESKGREAFFVSFFGPEQVDIRLEGREIVVSGEEWRLAVVIAAEGTELLESARFDET